MSTSWIRHWQPSADLFLNSHVLHDRNVHLDSTADHHPIKYNSAHRSSNLANFLPYLLSLGLLTNKQSSHHSPIPLETTGPFKTWYYWNEIDFAFDTPLDRKIAVESGEYIPENNLPLGIEVYGDRIFVTMPRWKPGVPATLAALPRIPREPSPLMVPYPSWGWHSTGLCSRLTSVFRMQADTCGRLWVLDSGQIDITTKPKQVCPPQVFVFDLETDELIVRYELPEELVKQDGLYSNIVVDIRDGDCEDAHAYLADVWRFGLVVFSYKRMRSWRITDHLFYPEPLAAAYNVHGLQFEWTDGLFGLALAPYDRARKDKILYFHPMSSFRQFYTWTSIVCNETGWQNYRDAFRVLGQSRGRLGHASASGMDRNGVLFYNMVSRSGVGCWDSRKPYRRDALGLIAQSNTTLVFPNDLRIDNEERQSVWILTNKLPYYLYDKLDRNDVNFRIMSAYADEAVAGSVCDPDVSYFGFHDATEEEEDCY